eukprot:CAMPEP_0194305892 /NCGR_PEP_ID=MMETSP0171-20130528/3214_1 /TAXON_ID=218684 /ORGANISM="Corethron pennatum, Strain L29A3" /LENGTH=90 /DNA_ID=CAMNT_0039057543 /DNA_START=130 /DNA_END=399 /DNA_ORIENTATION=+
MCAFLNRDKGPLRRRFRGSTACPRYRRPVPDVLTDLSTHLTLSPAHAPPPPAPPPPAVLLSPERNDASGIRCSSHTSRVTSSIVARSSTI